MTTPRPTATVIVLDLLNDAWNEHGSLNGWILACGTTVYAELIDRQRYHAFAYEAGVVTILGDAALPPNHVVLFNRVGVIVSGAHMVSPHPESVSAPPQPVR